MNFAPAEVSPLVRPQRGLRPEVLLPRLSLRRHRTVHRYAVGTGGFRLWLVKARPDFHPLIEMQRRPVGLHGPVEQEPHGASGVGNSPRCAGPGTIVRRRFRRLHELQLATGDGGRYRFEPRKTALCTARPELDPLFKRGCARQNRATTRSGTQDPSSKSQEKPSSKWSGRVYRRQA